MRGIACIGQAVHNRPRFDAVEEAGLPPGFFMPAIQVLDGSSGVLVIYWRNARSVMIQMSGGFWVARRWRKDIVKAALGAKTVQRIDNLAGRIQADTPSAGLVIGQTRLVPAELPAKARLANPRLYPDLANVVHSGFLND